jgi:hypothetical protein
MNASNLTVHTLANGRILDVEEIYFEDRHGDKHYLIKLLIAKGHLRPGKKIRRFLFSYPSDHIDLREALKCDSELCKNSPDVARVCEKHRLHSAVVEIIKEHGPINLIQSGITLPYSDVVNKSGIKRTLWSSLPNKKQIIVMIFGMILKEQAIYGAPSGSQYLFLTGKAASSELNKYHPPELSQLVKEYEYELIPSNKRVFSQFLGGHIKEVEQKDECVVFSVDTTMTGYAYPEHLGRCKYQVSIKDMTAIYLAITRKLHPNYCFEQRTYFSNDTVSYHHKKCGRCGSQKVLCTAIIAVCNDCCSEIILGKPLDYHTVYKEMARAVMPVYQDNMSHVKEFMNSDYFLKAVEFNLKAQIREKILNGENWLSMCYSWGDFHKTPAEEMTVYSKPFVLSEKDDLGGKQLFGGELDAGFHPAAAFDDKENVER